MDIENGFVRVVERGPEVSLLAGELRCFDAAGLERGWEVGRVFSLGMNLLCDWRVIRHLNADVSYWDNEFYARPHSPWPLSLLPRGEGVAVGLGFKVRESRSRRRRRVHESGAEAAAVQTLREETGVGGWLRNGFARGKRHPAVAGQGRLPQSRTLARARSGGGLGCRGANLSLFIPPGGTPAKSGMRVRGPGGGS